MTFTSIVFMIWKKPLKAGIKNSVRNHYPEEISRLKSNRKQKNRDDDEESILLGKERR